MKVQTRNMLHEKETCFMRVLTKCKTFNITSLSFGQSCLINGPYLSYFWQWPATETGNPVKSGNLSSHMTDISTEVI